MCLGLFDCSGSFRTGFQEGNSPNAVLDRRLTVPVERSAGYRNLSRFLTRMSLLSPKGEASPLGGHRGALLLARSAARPRGSGS